MRRNQLSVLLLLFALIISTTLVLSLNVSAATVNPIDYVSVADSGGTGSLSSGTVTITIKSSLVTRKTNTVTITNTGSETATLKFDYSVSNLDTEETGAFVINGDASYSANQQSSYSGNYSVLLDAGQSITISFRAPRPSKTATLKLSNFSLTVAAATSNVTFDYNNSLGSVTVDGSVVSSGETQQIALSGASLVATPNSGVSFLGWVDGEGRLLSSATSYTLQPAADMTVKAVFASENSSAWFLVDSAYLFDDLNSACTKGSTVVLAANGTLPAGNYTIPSGVTLLIPFDSANTLYTTAPGVVENSYSTPSVYRTLTMASGAHVTVNGALSVSGEQSSKMGYNGHPSGALGFIDMNSGSTITVNGSLYAWGYIKGSGAVTVKSGGVVYEDFQITDWHGGDATSNMIDNSNKVLPVNQYYVQNIEVPLTIEAGGIEKIYYSVYVSVAGVQSSTVDFIGPSGIFYNTSGGITKDYDESTDRLSFVFDGESTFSNLVLSIKVAILGSVTIDTAKYHFPVSNHLDIVLTEGSSMALNADVAMLPGATLKIEKDATITIGSGYSVYVYDASEWATLEVKTYPTAGTEIPIGTGFVYSNKVVRPVNYTTSRKTTSPRKTVGDAVVLVDGTLDVSAGYLYTTKSGASIISTGTGTVKVQAGKSDATTSQVVQGGNENKELVYYTIPLTSAQLLNGDASGYLATTSGTYVYHAEHKRWVLDAHTANGTGCNHAKTWTVCTCGATYDELARKYNVYVTDYQGNKTLLGNLAYGTAPSLTLKDTESNCFVISHTGWSYSGTTFAAASGFWALVTDANVTASTTDLTIEGQYTPTAIKAGAITMTVNYNTLPEGTAMQVIFFVPVETEDATAPSVLLNNDASAVTVTKVDGVLMYQVTVNLTAAQIAEKAEGDKSGNATITITYPDVNLTKQLDSILLAYAKALQSQLSSSAMGSQADAMEAVLNYGSAVQTYFNAGNGFDFAGYSDSEIAKYAENVTANVGTPVANAKGVTLNWASANVNFRTEYNLRYYFTLTGLSEGVIPTTATLTVTYADGVTTSTYENLAVEADGSRYRVTYPVPASDLAKEGTTVKLVVTLSDGSTVESTEFAYGINAYLKRSIYRYTTGGAKIDGDDAKTQDYVNMLVSLIKLGEAVSKIEGTAQ